MYERLGEVLEMLCREGRKEAVFVAPFIKRAAFGRLLSALPADVSLLCVTRWRPEEVAAGVSDPDIWLDMQQRARASLRLCPSLHAKYYRVDTACLIGSANITGAALSWTTTPNLEILYPFGGSLAEGQAFEGHLLSSSVLCQEVIYQEMKATVSLLQAEPRAYMLLRDAATELPAETATTNDVTADTNNIILSDPSIWLPQSRQPSDLFLTYSDQWPQLTSASHTSTQIDLAVLQIPRELPQPVFTRYVAAQLLQFPCIAAVDAFVTQSQRFGAVTAYLKTLPCSKSTNFDATRAWQTLMRWLLYFLPERYEHSVPRHSEVFQVRK